MTGQLRSTLHDRAADLEIWDADLSSIVRDGNRRLRRRRTALVSGVAALALVAGGTALGLRDRHATAEPAPSDTTTKPFTYAVGSVIHSGSKQYDVGVPVDSMVQTATGVVFADPRLRVYLEQEGDVRQIGHLADRSTRLVTGDDGQVVGWWDGQNIATWPGYGGNPTNTLTPDPASPRDITPRVEAISDGHVWLWEGHATWVAEVAPMTSTAMWKDTGFAGPDTLQDAAGDRVLVRVGPANGPDGLAVTRANLRPTAADRLPGWKPGTDLSGLAPQVRDVSSGDLAPDGKHWFTDDSDQFAVFDSATGERQDPSYRSLGFAFAAPYQWLGDDTIAVLAMRDPHVDQPRISLLTCHVSSNDCVVTADDIGDATNVAIPVGRSLAAQ